jgi:hypothetical protein
MAVYKLLPNPQAYGYALGILLLDHVEVHAPGDTANALTYDFPVLFKVVPGASAYRVTTGDPAVRDAIVSAARELVEAGVKGISSNCGFMIHYQDDVARAVDVPVMLSSLMQLPLAMAAIGPDKRIAILTAFTERLHEDVLALARLPEGAKVAVTSIQDTEEFKKSTEQDLDTNRFGGRLVEAVERLLKTHDDIGAVLLECAIFTPYAKRIQESCGLPVFDFVSLIDHLYAVSHRRGGGENHQQ